MGNTDLTGNSTRILKIDKTLTGLYTQERIALEVDTEQLGR